MKAGQGAGLVIGGGLQQSFLSRMPVLLREIGPVKAASYRVARRLVNTLRAGFAVTEYRELEPCPLIWISVPDSDLNGVAQDFASQISLEGKMVVLCGSTRESASPGPLVDGRASVASLNVLEHSDERIFVTEGEPRVIRELGRIARAEKRKLIEIKPKSKELFFAGSHLATHLVLPWIAAAVESLRAAGFSRAEATKAVENMGIRSLKAYAKAGRKAWSPEAASELRRSLKDNGSLDPNVRDMYAEGVRQALGYFENDNSRRAS